MHFAKLRAPAAVASASRDPIVDRPDEGTENDNASQACFQHRTIRIDLTSLGHGRFAACVAASGQGLVASSSRPFVDGARRLLELGHHPNTILEMSHHGASGISLRAMLSSAAGLDVKETAHGPKFVGHRQPERSDCLSVPDRPYRRGAVARVVPHPTLEIAASASSSTVGEARRDEPARRVPRIGSDRLRGDCGKTCLST
jgi:hypothetical protein